MATVYVNRPVIKEAAKKALKGNYGTAIAAMLVVGLVSGAISGISEFISVVLRVVTTFAPSVQFIAIMVSFAAAIATFFVSSALSVGLYSLYIKISRGVPTNAAQPFRYMKYTRQAAGLYFLIVIKVMLWSMLFVIPGIIAMYRYSMAPYIMADNPDISISDAINESKKLMNGNKWRYFVLDLSFLGWELLVPLTCGVLYFWLTPYMEVTRANFYNALVYAHSAQNTEAPSEETVNTAEISE